MYQYTENIWYVPTSIIKIESKLKLKFYDRNGIK